MEAKKKREGILSRLKELCSEKKKAILLLIVALCGLFLIFGGQETLDTGTDYAREREEYRKETETRLQSLCERVQGVGRVSVFVTLEAGEEYVYATDESAGGGVDYVTGQSGGLLLYRRAPRVAGVAVVCDGGGNENVRNELQLLLHAALDVPYGRISISPAKSASVE